MPGHELTEEARRRFDEELRRRYERERERHWKWAESPARRRMAERYYRSREDAPISDGDAGETSE